MRQTPANRRKRFICVDANAVVQGAWHLESAAWRVLLYQSRTGLSRVILPDLMLREIVGRFEEELRKRIRGAEKSLASLAKMVGRPVDPPTIDIPGAVEQYEQDLRTLLVESEVLIADLPDVDINELADRAITRQRPFDDGGSGFRDALLWLLFIDLLKDSPDADGVLVSNDGKAYWNEDRSGLHPELVSEAATMGVSTPISIYESIPDYLEKEAVGDARLLALVSDEAIQQQDLLAGRVSDSMTRAIVQSDALGVQAELRTLIESELLLLRMGGTPSPENSALLLVEFLVVGRARFNWWLVRVADMGEIESRVYTTATASFNQATSSFADLTVEAPALLDCPELMDAVTSARMNREHAAASLEQVRRLSEMTTLPESTLEQVRRLSEMTTLPESTLEQMRRLTTLPESHHGGTSAASNGPWDSAVPLPLHFDLDLLRS